MLPPETILRNIQDSFHGFKPEMKTRLLRVYLTSPDIIDIVYGDTEYPFRSQLYSHGDQVCMRVYSDDIVPDSSETQLFQRVVYRIEIASHLSLARKVLILQCTDNYSKNLWKGLGYTQNNSYPTTYEFLLPRVTRGS